MWKALKQWYEIIWQGKEYVLNLSNGKIHHYTCEWCDNIKNFRRITIYDVDMLLHPYDPENKEISMASCCKNKFVI